MGTSLISKDTCPEGGWCMLIISGTVDPQGKGAWIFSHILCSPPPYNTYCHLASGG